MKKTIFKQNNILNIFFTFTTVGLFVAMLGIILYYIFAFASLYNGSEDFEWLLSIFSDFVEVMNFAIEESPYVVEGSSYPPLAIFILMPFALICKDVFAVYASQTLSVSELTSKLTISPQFWIALVIFFLICTVSIVLLISKKFGFKGLQFLKISAIITFGAPFVYSVMRGNTIYFALIFLLIFLLLKDSKNSALREISYVSLAVAGCLKIYPLFFGVFLLKDKKIWASIRVAVYFCLIFFFSFCLFERGLVDISEFVDNLSGFMGEDHRLLATNNLSISALVYKAVHLIVPSTTSDSVWYSVLNIGTIAITFAIATFCAVYTKNEFSRYVIAASMVILIPSISYFYVLIFICIPFMEYIKTADTMGTKRATFYLFAFFFLFATCFILAKNFIPHSLIVLTMFIIETVRIFKDELIPNVKARRNAKMIQQ